MSAPPTSDSGSGVQVEEDAVLVLPENEVTVNEGIPRGFGGNQEKDEIDGGFQTSFAKPDCQAKDADPIYIRQHKSRLGSRKSSDRFSQTAEGLENLNCGRDSSKASFTSPKGPPPGRNYFLGDNSNDVGVSGPFRQSYEALQISDGRIVAAANEKDGMSSHRRVRYGSDVNRLIVTKKGRCKELPSRKRRGPVGYLEQENIFHRGLAYVRHEVYPPWQARIPRLRQTAIGFMDESPCLKAFSGDGGPQPSNSSMLTAPDRCVICQEPLPLDYNGDTCSKCGGRVCQECIERERIHWPSICGL